MRTTNRWVTGSIMTIGGLLVALTVACGGDDEDPTAAPTEATSATAATAASDDGASAGQITIGEDTWELDPRQCSMFSDGSVSISGFAVRDADVEIVFDVFADESTNLSVETSDRNWSAFTDNIEATVDGKTVTGTSTVSANGETADATFEFNCD